MIEDDYKEFRKKLLTMLLILMALSFGSGFLVNELIHTYNRFIEEKPSEEENQEELDIKVVKLNYGSNFKTI